MQHTDNFAERPLRAVIEAIASADVAPGAGSAAAVGLALAAACAGKAVAITLKRRPDDAVLARAQNELAGIAHRALRGADEDAARFREFVHEKSASSAHSLVHLGQRLQALGAELLAVLDRLDGCIDSAVVSDIAAARALGAAFGAIQSENLEESEEAADRIEGEPAPRT
jgi:hypothetical protein